MTPKNRIIEGKNRFKGGEGWSKMTQKKSDIIYEWSLWGKLTLNKISDSALKLVEFVKKKINKRCQVASSKSFFTMQNKSTDLFTMIPDLSENPCSHPKVQQLLRYSLYPQNLPTYSRTKQSFKNLVKWHCSRWPAQRTKFWNPWKPTNR